MQKLNAIMDLVNHSNGQQLKQQSTHCEALNALLDQNIANIIEREHIGLNNLDEDTIPTYSRVLLNSDISDADISNNDIGTIKKIAKNIPNMKTSQGLSSNNSLCIVKDEIIIDDNSNINVSSKTVVEAMIKPTNCMPSSEAKNLSENIVFRRKTQKNVNSSISKAPKKRVSFHEDILKNKRTDNIHIEHGFITYKNGKNMDSNIHTAGRYSWCVEGKVGSAELPELCLNNVDDNNSDVACGTNMLQKRVIYRNACSDVIDYGNSYIYDTNEKMSLCNDDSGVFEYNMYDNETNHEIGKESDIYTLSKKFYTCSCASSDSSLLYNEAHKNNNNNSSYHQSKSHSYDCIGLSTINNNLIGNNCYFSEPNIDNINTKKSVWNKEKMPKNSCLKKTKYNNVTFEQDINRKIKKFNVHDMNQLLDNSSKVIFGSLKSIFALPVPERGVPEGSEDLQTVAECLPELETIHEKNKMPKGFIEDLKSPQFKPKNFLSKSFEGSKVMSLGKKFVHNVDQQLRRKNEEDIYISNDLNKVSSPFENEISLTSKKKSSSQSKNELGNFEIQEVSCEISNDTMQSFDLDSTKGFRNKFIVNCESTVFEHVGISYETDKSVEIDVKFECSAKEENFMKKTNRPSTKESIETKSLITTPFSKSILSFFKSFKEPSSYSDGKSDRIEINTHRYPENKIRENAQQSGITMHDDININKTKTNCSASTSSNSNTSLLQKREQEKQTCSIPYKDGSGLSADKSNVKNIRHLPSPLKKYMNMPYIPTQRHYLNANDKNHLASQCTDLHISLSSNSTFEKNSSGHDSQCTTLSEDFDDILTITSSSSNKPESSIVIVEYPDINDRLAANDFANLLKVPQQTNEKTSIINRFLRNITQKKVIGTLEKKSDFLIHKMRGEKRVNLYVPRTKPKNNGLIDDLNAEIAFEIRMYNANLPKLELPDQHERLERSCTGVGEVDIEIFNGKILNFLKHPNEKLNKVFKLYIGYNNEGLMKPVVVFLSNKFVYVTDLVNNCLNIKFVLSYEELDVILMGPYGNTVLLSNNTRDMQQVLLAGGPYQASALVSNIELAARRHGCTLPAVGHLTLEHFSPLQDFVRVNSCVGKNENWLYYAIINVPAAPFNYNISNNSDINDCHEPNVKGFLMHRTVKSNFSKEELIRTGWNPGYFELKAGILYMYNDATQMHPSCAIALADECQGALRSLNVGRPYCFEIILQETIFQLAAPDEYVASEWLQKILDAASRRSQYQQKHKTLGCSLIITQNHLITFREDFSAPLRQITKSKESNRAILELEKYACCLEQTSFYENQIKTQYAEMCSVYGKDSGLLVLTCANIKDLMAIKISSQSDSWWCMLEFSCQLAPLEGTDDLILFFACSLEMQRFLRILEDIWQAKSNELFPITILDEDDVQAKRCTMLYTDINRAWKPIIATALGVTTLNLNHHI